MRPLTALEKRLAAITLSLLVLAAVAAAVVFPYRLAARHYDEAIETRLDEIARYQRIAAAKQSVQKAIAEVNGRDARKFFLKSSASALAAADIQQIVQTLVEANALQLESMQIAAPKNEDGYRRIALNLRLRGKLAGLQNTLYSLEMTQPYLFIDNLSIQSTVRPNFRPTPGVEPDVMSQFDLYGYAQVIKSDVAPRR